jgi:hypothetical protein
MITLLKTKGYVDGIMPCGLVIQITVLGFREGILCVQIFSSRVLAWTKLHEHAKKIQLLSYLGKGKDIFCLYRVYKG